MFGALPAYVPTLPPGIPLTYRNLLTDPTKQGKVAELRLELNSSGGKKDKNFSTKKIALKKIVANMTMSNNDMVALFPDIIGVMGVPSLEIKKMCVGIPCQLGCTADMSKVLPLSRQLCTTQA